MHHATTPCPSLHSQRMHTLEQTHTSGLGSTDDCSALCFFEEGGYKAVSQRLHSSQSLTTTAKASSILAYNTAGASGGAVAVLSKSSLAMDGYTVRLGCAFGRTSDCAHEHTVHATQLRHNLGVIGGGVAVKQSSMQASEVAIECCCSVRQAGGAISVDGVQPGAESGDAVQLDVSHSVLKVSPFLSLAPASREWVS